MVSVSGDKGKLDESTLRAQVEELNKAYATAGEPSSAQQPCLMCRMQAGGGLWAVGVQRQRALEQPAACSCSLQVTAASAAPPSVGRMPTPPTSSPAVLPDGTVSNSAAQSGVTWKFDLQVGPAGD